MAEESPPTPQGDASSVGPAAEAGTAANPPGASATTPTAAAAATPSTPATASDNVEAAASSQNTTATATAPPDGSDAPIDGLDEVSIEELLKQASFEDPSAIGGGGGPGVDASEFKLPNFQQVIQDAQVSSIDLLRDVELNVKIELGRARMLVEDVLKLSEGSVVELDKLAGDPVDVFVNERLVARGEVLVLNDNFCVRVNEIVAGVKEEGL